MTSPKAGAGAAIGGILGAVLGGGKGALLGVLIGGGGTIAATEGKELELPQGTVLRVRLDSPLQVQALDSGYLFLTTSFIAARAAAIVVLTSRSV